MSDSRTIEVEELLEHVGWVRALARRLVRDPAEADDIAQEAMVSAISSPPLGGRDVRKWLGRVVGNTWRMRRRSAQRRRRHEELGAAGTESDSAYGVDLVEQLERQRELATLESGARSTIRREAP